MTPVQLEQLEFAWRSTRTAATALACIAETTGDETLHSEVARLHAALASVGGAP